MSNKQGSGVNVAVGGGASVGAAAVNVAVGSVVGSGTAVTVGRAGARVSTVGSITSVATGTTVGMVLDDPASDRLQASDRTRTMTSSGMTLRYIFPPRVITLFLFGKTILFVQAF